jgi:hypothetical protein
MTGSRLPEPIDLIAWPIQSVSLAADQLVSPPKIKPVEVARQRVKNIRDGVRLGISGVHQGKPQAQPGLLLCFRFRQSIRADDVSIRAHAKAHFYDCRSVIRSRTPSVDVRFLVDWPYADSGSAGTQGK